ncbi:tRNA lysidine(34) synthetase TilS [Aliivibrio finisterrensis]|uniref:tRNA(Ile)-lysidine synthase n=1 Tax=Aliivibrio finisterrensis TaxID=511998 RepID=A0A6N6RV41_9GAMM|nr:tRNA lysidine(34) synthetase TilS [Aliivibrio finisterrensis]KAB2825555.1 tRNA lysidine(34) synthetase TilS [Aliivibrio finisterrensis]
MLYSQFSSQLASYPVATPHLVVALSGGIDSMVLLRLASIYAKDKQLECIAVHVNHGLSQHAYDWEAVCQVHCDSLAIPLNIERVQLVVSAQDSLEEVARKARYKALDKHMQANSLLLTGQHQDDQAETFFLALKRGSGPAGLSSMPSITPLSQGYKCRPLLSVSRTEIEQYGQENQLEWVEDESNNDTRFDRNFLRHDVVPNLVQRWPSFTSAVSRSAQLCAEQESLLNELLSPKLVEFQNAYQGISILRLIHESPLARNMLLRLWLKQFAIPLPSQVQLGVLWNEVAQAKEDANPTLALGSVQLRRSQGYLYCLPHYEELSEWRSELKDKLLLPDALGKLTLLPVVAEDKAATITSSNQEALLLRAPSENEKVEVRFNVVGLTPHPEARQHSRKMKKLYQEYEVPSWQRTRMPMVFYNDELAAVAGLFVCKKFSGEECELHWHKTEFE